jgi:DNA-binding NtrC family response regulator
MTISSQAPPAGEMIGRAPCMQELGRRISALASYDVNLLLNGESGTGKELVARLVHDRSRRGRGPFVGVNCAAVHETLLESELFGHDAGAFTGAGHATLGFLRAADGGTILLDEIGDMSLALQSKLLRVLEERAVVPVGSTTPIPVDIRVIAATHMDLGEAVKGGTFRQDLYYRLNVVQLLIPPLRERAEDIPLLAQHLLRRTAKLLDVPGKEISPEAMASLVAHDWPGNVRELGNVIQRAYVLGRSDRIESGDLPDALRRRSDEGTPPGFPTLRQVTYRHVVAALQQAEGVRSRAARMLGIDRKTLWRMIHRYGLTG